MLSLSEAILLGSTMIKPKRGTILYFGNGADGRVEEAGCALGMAYKAAGFIYDDFLCGATTIRIPHDSPIFAALHSYVQVPCECFGKKGSGTLADIIAHLFDNHVVFEGNQPPDAPWTLEQLVDWVRSVETEHADEQWAKHAKLTEEAVTV